MPKQNNTNAPEAEQPLQPSEEKDIYEAAKELREEQEAEKNKLIQKNDLKLRRIKVAFAAFGLFVGYFVFSQLFYLVFSQDTLQNNGTVKLLASFMGFFVYFFFLIRYYMKRTQKTGETVGDILHLRPRALSPKPAALCAALGVSLNLSISALLELLPLPEALINDYSAGSEALLYTDSLGFSIIYIALLAPICEELMFRGFMYHRMRTCYSVRVSVIVVSIAFALPHISVLWIIVALINSFIFTMIRERYDNLCYSMILHSCYNLVSVPMLVLMEFSPEVYSVFFDNIIAELIYLVLGGAAVFFCIRALLINRQEGDDGEVTYQIGSHTDVPLDKEAVHHRRFHRHQARHRGRLQHALRRGHPALRRFRPGDG